MNKTFIVATNADLTLLCIATDEKEAIKKANLYEEREDWEAYDAIDYLNDMDGVMAIRSWVK